MLIQPRSCTIYRLHTDIAQHMKIILALLMLSTTLLPPISYAHGGEDHKHLTREQVAWQKSAQGALIVDVRTAQEYGQQQIANAINIPYKKIVKQFKALEVRKDRIIVLYCRSGNRAGKAIMSLRKAGYTNLHNAGGINDFLAAKP
jgi:phage shock protein E